MFRKLVILLIVGCGGASCAYHESDQPLWPKVDQLSGWRVVSHGGVTTAGEFVLKKGESVENDRIGVTLVDVRPGDWLADRGSFYGKARAVFRFYTVADKTTVCEVEFARGGHRLDGFRNCNGLGFDVLHVAAINTRDDWALFQLRGPGNPR